MGGFVCEHANHCLGIRIACFEAEKRSEWGKTKESIPRERRSRDQSLNTAGICFQIKIIASRLEGI